MTEISKGKNREYDNIFDALRREVLEEIGLEVTYIQGEESTISSKVNGYKAISIRPFCITQNLSGGYSLILQTFLCHAIGNLQIKTNETTNIH